MAVTPASVRITQSRNRLRLALQQRQNEQQAAAHSSGPAWLDALRAEPGTRVLLDALGLWWTQQPWHGAAASLAASLRQLLRPLAQRNPFLLVLGAAALGGALVWLKPWRWLTAGTVAAGLLPALLPALLAKLPDLLRPLSWAEALSTWLKACAKPGP